MGLCGIRECVYMHSNNTLLIVKCSIYSRAPDITYNNSVALQLRLKL